MCTLKPTERVLEWGWIRTHTQEEARQRVSLWPKTCSKDAIPHSYRQGASHFKIETPWQVIQAPGRDMAKENRIDNSKNNKTELI